MPRPSQADKIFEAALACFAEVGYDATRIRAIAERAGVSEGALYRHYPSKEAIAHSVYHHHLHQVSTRVQQVAAMDEVPEAMVRHIVAVVLAMYRENPAAMTFVLLHQSTIMPMLAPDTLYPLDVIERVIAHGQQIGAVRAGQPNLLAAILLGCVLRPLIVSHLAQPGTLDLVGDQQHDGVIADAAWAAVARPV